MAPGVLNPLPVPLASGGDIVLVSVVGRLAAAKFNLGYFWSSDVATLAV